MRRTDEHHKSPQLDEHPHNIITHYNLQQYTTVALTGIKTMPSIKDYFTSFADSQKIERLKQCLEIERALYDCERIHKRVLEETPARNGNRNGNTVSSIGRMFQRRSAPTQHEHEHELKENNSFSSPSPSDEPEKNGDSHRLQDSRAGMKIARFYDWGLSNPRAQEALAAMRGAGDGGLRSLHPDSPNEAEAESESESESGSTSNGTCTIDIDIDTFSSRVHLDASNSSCSREHHAVWGCRAMALGCAPELVQLKKCFQKHENNHPTYFAYDDDQTDSDEVQAHAHAPDENDCRLDMQKLGQCVSTNWKLLDARVKKS